MTIPRQRDGRRILEPGDGLRAPVEVASILSGLVPGLRVTKQQMNTWAARRDRNGFPMPVEYRRHNGRDTPFYDPQAVYEWWLRYEPAKGGATYHQARRAG